MFKKRTSKYGVSKKEDRTYNGKVYDSKLEMRYRQHLDLLTKAVKDCDRVILINEQVPYECFVEGKKICTYMMDYEVEYANGNIEFVDVKGVRTAIYRLKKKLVEAIYGIEIKEVTTKDF